MCTGVRFATAEGDLYFGRNLDWSFSYGEKILATPRGYDYRTAFGAPAGSYAVFGVGIVSEGLPLYFDCANEKKLAIAGLNFPGYAAYEEHEIAGKTNVAAYEFPFWVVRNFATVDEVEAAMKDVAIVGKQINAQYPVSYLHWLVADGTRSIVIEYMADGVHVYDDPVDVLTNQPTFAYHIENIRNYVNDVPEYPAPATWDKATLTPWGSGTSMHGLPGDYSSPSRFVRAAYANAHYPEQADEQHNVTRLFKTLQAAAMVDGGAKMEDGQFEKTVYTSGFSGKTMTYYKNEYDDFAIKSYRFADFDMDGKDIQQA